MRRWAPKMGNLSWRLGIAQNCSWRFAASLRVVCKPQIAKSNGQKLWAVEVQKGACAGGHQKWANFPGAWESLKIVPGGSQQACESFASLRSPNQMARNFAQLRWKETHAQVGTKNGQTFLAHGNRSKLFLEVRSKPASRFPSPRSPNQMLKNCAQLRLKETHAQVGTKMGKLSWRLGIAQNCCWRFAASLRVDCKPQIAKSNGQKLCAVEVERDACAGGHQKWANFPGAWESLKIVPGGLEQACESIASLRSGNRMARNFAQLRWKETHAQLGTKNGQTFLALGNRSKLFLEVCSKPASRLQASDREIKWPETLRS